ncbi:hypothetical protein Pmani_025781 [Petrolisthes manimaculis]|uniref:Uncharacterized protein n=1 Tax=Petrolisthes manimaculis TaxID=1843537 RepID=A0AAE1TXC2_9EUCA|nr:hypothetical protein Pmani_025781 [Petrolisthes manimaculis]
MMGSAGGEGGQVRLSTDDAVSVAIELVWVRPSEVKVEGWATPGNPPGAQPPPASTPRKISQVVPQPPSPLLALRWSPVHVALTCPPFPVSQSLRDDTVRDDMHSILHL